MESPLSKVSRDMERLNQSLARMKAVDSAETTQVDVTTSESLSQSSVIPDSINILSTVASPLSPVQHPVKLHFDDCDTRIIPQLDRDAPHLQFFSSLNTSTSPISQSSGEELMRARALAESAYARVSAAEALCAELGKRISLVEHHTMMGSSPVVLESETRLSQLHESNNTANYSSPGRKMNMNSSRTNLSSLVYNTARPDSLNGSVKSPLQSKRSAHSPSNSRASKSTILAQARAHESVLYGKSWGKPLETSRAEIDSPPPSDTSSDEDEDEIGDEIFDKVEIVQGRIGNADEDNVNLRIFPTKSILSQSMMAMKQQDESSRSTQVATQSPRKNFVPEQSLSRSHEMTFTVHDDESLDGPSCKTVHVPSRRIQVATQSPRKSIVPEQSLSRSQTAISTLHEDAHIMGPNADFVQIPSIVVSRQEPVSLSTLPIALTTTTSETQSKSLSPSATTRTGGEDSSLKDKFESRLTKLEAELNIRHMTEIKENEKTIPPSLPTLPHALAPSIDNADEKSKEREETEAENAAAALELHADMSTAAALEVSLLQEKLREVNEALLQLRQEVASMPSRGASPLINDDDDDDDESREENTDCVDVSSPKRTDSHIQSSQSTAQTAASALIRCAELEGRLNAAKLEGQVKEHRWISSVQAAQLGVVVKAVQDCVVALAPKTDHPTSLRRIPHEKPQRAVGSRRDELGIESYVQHGEALRQAYWPNERSLFHRPCWGRERSGNDIYSMRHTSAHFSRRGAKETAEKELNDVVDRLRSTLSTCAVVIDMDNVAKRYHSSTRGNN